MPHEKYKITSKQLPKKIGVSTETFRKWKYIKKGSNTTIPADKLAMIANFFDIRIEEIFNYSIPKLTYSELESAELIEHNRKMKKTVRETLKLAVEQLFVRIHGDLFDVIYDSEKSDFKVTDLIFDDKNEAHVELVKLCKEKLGCEPVATNQDVFYSIMRVYVDAHEKEKKKSV